jgi:hypothetical protein
MMDWSSPPIKTGLTIAALFLFLALLSDVSIGQAKRTRNLDRARINSKGELTSNSIRKNMSKYRYDNGGHFECNLLAFNIRKQKEADPCDEKKVRDFIWDHFTLKRRGYIRVRYSGIDAGSVEHLFVEPQRDGKWIVTRWSVGYSAYSRRADVYPKQLLTQKELKSFRLVTGS